MANRPISSQTSSNVDMSQSVDAQPPLLRVYTFGAFHLDWQVPPCTTEDLWKSRTSARTLLKLLLCAPGRQASRSQLAGILWPETDEDKARESLRSASKVLRKTLLRGEFLADDQGSEWMRHRWIKQRQQALRLGRSRMVRHLADMYLQRGQVSLAEEILEQ